MAADAEHISGSGVAEVKIGVGIEAKRVKRAIFRCGGEQRACTIEEAARIIGKRPFAAHMSGVLPDADENIQPACGVDQTGGAARHTLFGIRGEGVRADFHEGRAVALRWIPYPCVLDIPAAFPVNAVP